VSVADTVAGHSAGHSGWKWVWPAPQKLAKKPYTTGSS